MNLIEERMCALIGSAPLLDSLRYITLRFAHFGPFYLKNNEGRDCVCDKIIPLCVKKNKNKIKQSAVQVCIPLDGFTIIIG